MNKDYKLYVHIAPNGKRYYGITKQEKVNRRWENGKGYKQNKHFTSAINKYGWDNIQHIVLQEGLDEEEAKELEQYMIQWYGTANHEYGYNNSLGGESGNPSEETRKKLSKAFKGRCPSEETRKKMSEARKGEKHYMYGKHHTEEAKKKLSEAHKGKYTGKDNPTSKSVICITTNSVFYSGMEAGRYYNISNKSISRCCKGKLKSAGKSPTGEKLVWRYIDIIEL